MRVKMTPHLSQFKNEESGIRRVVEAYFKYLPEYDIQLVARDDDNYDLSAIHAGTFTNFDKSRPLVAHCHGMYWSADYTSEHWEHEANRNVIYTIRNAREVTVPSRWVQEVFQRDMRFSPHIVPHGIEWDKWQHSQDNIGYVLWNKNRHADVCDPKAVGELADRFPEVVFVTTFAPFGKAHQNVREIGLQTHPAMKRILQSAGVYLSSTKETFSVGNLEAMASGIPILGFDHGGNQIMVKHGVNGYLARPGDWEDLAEGLAYCRKYRDVLGANGREMAREWTWNKACAEIYSVYQLALVPDPPTVSIIIPSFNYADKVGRAIDGALKQTYPIESIVVVDDGSTDDGATQRVVEDFSTRDHRVRYMRQDNSGVANARNAGIGAVSSKYICCLDADDTLQPEFIRVCVEALEADLSLGIAYTGLYYIRADGSEGLSTWPTQFDFDKQLKRQNQIPTACVFRREAFERLGGYKKRYCADLGAGSEDAELWLRMGAYGYGAKKVTDAGLFVYSWQTGRVSGNKQYREVDWLAMHPWVKDGKHPFASVAAPENKLSHLVRQYDEPGVSVVIPVGESHFDLLPDALDSLESQTYRKWEAIVVLDFGVDSERYMPIKYAYPYVHWVLAKDGDRRGAGRARNLGAQVARAPLLLFLDCDDMLFPEAIEKMVSAYKKTGNIVYSDYLGKALMSREDAEKLGARLVSYDGRKGEAVIHYKSAEYDCDMALTQPNTSRIYIWNLITSLVPTAWHRAIGGFDEKMESWEDWDYWLRLARSGRCFVHIPEELVVYWFYTGTRRDRGVEINQHLLQYLTDKYRGAEVMPCNCGKPNRVFIPPAVQPAMQAEAGGKMAFGNLKDDDVVLVEYLSSNRGSHKIVGIATKKFLGYRSGGERFYIPRADLNAMKNIFREIGDVIEHPVDAPKQTPPPPTVLPEPKPVSESAGSFASVSKFLSEEAHPIPPEFKPSLLAGVTPGIEDALLGIGASTPEEIIALGEDGLLKIKGVGASRASAIIESARAYQKASEAETEPAEPD